MVGHPANPWSRAEESPGRPDQGDQCSWGAYWGVILDRYGIRWMVNHIPAS